MPSWQAPVRACWLPIRTSATTGTPGKPADEGRLRRAAHTVRSVRTARSLRRRMLRGLSVSSSWSRTVRSSAVRVWAALARRRFRLLSA